MQKFQELSRHLLSRLRNDRLKAPKRPFPTLRQQSLFRFNNYRFILNVFVVLGLVAMLYLCGRQSMAFRSDEVFSKSFAHIAALPLSPSKDVAHLLKPRILYYNRHSACHANMIQVTTRLNLTFTPFKPTFLGGLGMRGDRANSIINDGFVRILCSLADVIIVGDTMPDARPLIQSLVRESAAERCQANIILELTTRFDWGVPDRREYYKLLWRLTHQPPKNLYWVTNNPFEPLDMSFEAFASPRIRLLRPNGFSTLEAQNITEEDKNLALCREKSDSAIFAMMQKLGIPFKQSGHGYGGPKTLAKYKAFIEFPYQVSTMKLYENLAAGVIMLLPSKDFFRELVEKDLHAFGPWDKISRAGDNWHLFMDYYSPEIAPYVYYFSSFEQLKAMLTSGSNLDSKNVRVEAPKAYEKLVTKMLHGWADIFGEMGYEVTVDGEKHVQGSGYPAFQAAIYDETAKSPVTEGDWEEAWKKLEEWKEMKRNVHSKRARITRSRMTEIEMDAYTISLERMSPNSKLFAQLDSRFNDIDGLLIQLCDFMNGEKGKDGASVFGGSLIGIDGVDELVAKGMKTVYDLLMSISLNVTIGPSNYAAVSKLQRAFRIGHTMITAASQRSQSPEKNLADALKTEERFDLEKKIDLLSKVIYPWGFSKQFSGMKDLVDFFTTPRGIVLTFGNGGFEQGLLNIMHIRKNLNCSLPVQVFYNGLEDLDQDKVKALNRLDGVSTKNLQEVFGGLTKDRNYHSKPFAILASCFKQIIYIDDDVILFQNPEKLLENSKLFHKYGSLLFKGLSHDFGHSKSVRWLIKSPSLVASTTGRYFRDISKEEMDASLMLFDKTKLSVVHGLLAACYLNLKAVREGGFGKHLQGDKETYWLAFELLRVPYKFAPGIAGAAGSLQEKDGKTISNSVCGPQSHLDEFGKLLHVNSRSGRYNHELDKWAKTLSHYIVPQSEIPGNIDSTHQPWCVTAGEGDSKEVFEVGQKEKEVLLKLRDLSMELRHKNWKQYLENNL